MWPVWSTEFTMERIRDTGLQIMRKLKPTNLLITKER